MWGRLGVDGATLRTADLTLDALGNTHHRRVWRRLVGAPADRAEIVRGDADLPCRALRNVLATMVQRGLLRRTGRRGYEARPEGLKAASRYVDALLTLSSHAAGR